MFWPTALATLAFGPAIGPAFGQEASDEVVEEIVVTGSRLLRRDFGAPSPIATIDAEVLAFSGQPTLEETLNQLPQITPDFGRTSNNPGNGTARINLRGLGSGRNLVLLNGRRLAPSGVGNAVDVNNLPKALIQQVEIITGGASTVYGSDAIAGVVNFITRDDFEGFSLDASAYSTEAGDSQSWDVNVAWGTSLAGRGNLTLYGGYLDREASLASDREFTAVPLVDNDGVLEDGGSFTTPETTVFFPRVDLGGGPDLATFDPNGVPVRFDATTDLYNFAPLNYLQVPLSRYSGGVLFDYAFSERMETYAELSFARNESRQNLAPVPSNGFFVINPSSPVLSPEASQLFASQFVPVGPGLVGFAFGRRLEELEPRILDNKAEYSRGVVGLRGVLAGSWEYDAWLSYTRGDEERVQRNGASRSRLQQGLLVDPVSGDCFDPSGGCVALNIFGAGNLSAAGTDFLRLEPLLNVTERTQRLASAFVRGTPFSTWAGEVGVAVGLEWRSDEGSFDADPFLFSGDALGYSGRASVEGEETVKEIYAEARIPLAADVMLADSLMLEVGGRYSDYRWAGSTETYKLGAEWRPVEALLIRSMFQRSVRAPSLLEAFEEEFLQSGTFVGRDSDEDPCSASADPIGNGRVDKCVSQGIPVEQLGVWEATIGYPIMKLDGGNTSLTPEVAETFTLGAVYTPLGFDGLQVSVDYYDLAIDDAIRDLVPAVACFDPANVAGLFCDAMVRDPSNYNVELLDERVFNTGRLVAEGIDTQIVWQTELPSSAALVGSSANLGISLIWTHSLTTTIQESPFGTAVNCQGKFGFPCNFATDGVTFPDNRVTANFSYQSDALYLNLSTRWIEGTKNGYSLATEILGFAEADLAIPSVGSKTYVDVGGSYQFTDNVVLQLSILNLTDTDPPLMADAVISNNTDTQMYDIFGRSYQLALSLRY
ncbi:MAG: TonB-dependent receptor [Woeseiaceae bacterium]|nr:TonB-dependent receptor [Woeseiaceae bacterium]